jgi:DNA-binding transcriptional regulator/RsmH inhibitor MraZ
MDIDTIIAKKTGNLVCIRDFNSILETIHAAQWRGIKQKLYARKSLKRPKVNLKKNIAVNEVFGRLLVYYITSSKMFVFGFLRRETP